MAKRTRRPSYEDLCDLLWYLDSDADDGRQVAYEALGLLLEAGAASVPVVSTKVGGILDVVNDQETGLLVDRDSTEELTNALRQLLIDPALRDRLATAHQKRSATFTIEKMVNETLSIYRQT